VLNSKSEISGRLESTEAISAHRQATGLTAPSEAQIWAYPLWSHGTLTGSPAEDITSAFLWAGVLLTLGDVVSHAITWVFG